MPTMCVAFGCFKKGGHLFPKDESLRKKWIAALKREKFLPSRNSVVCSDHFLPTDYKTEIPETGDNYTYRRLKKTAVPSVFPWRRNLINELAAGRKARLESRKRCQSTPSQWNSLCHDSDAIGLLPQSDVDEPRLESVWSVDMLPTDIGCEVDIVSDGTDEASQPAADASQPSDDTICLDENQKEKSVKPEIFKNSPNLSKEGDSSVLTARGSLSYDWVQQKSLRVKYFTGLENADKLNVVFHSLGPAAYELIYRYGHVSNISVKDQFLMALIKLRRATPDVGLAVYFDVSRKVVQNIVVTWIKFMYQEWSGLNIWPSKELVMYYMPEGFRKMYPSTRVILDGTEIPIATPKNPMHQQAAFSTYKNRPTVEVLVGSTPGGLISHVSPAYAGSVSDRAIVERSDLFNKCDPGDSIMADRGFTVQDLFAPYNVTVNIPAFLKGKAQIPSEQLLKDRKLASKRVHIERIIGMTKTYKILKDEMPAFYVPLASEIFFVCAMLCNFRNNIVGSDA